LASDQVVTSKDVLAALLEVRRRGRHRVRSELEKLEPDLTEYALEQLSAVHHAVLDAAVRPAHVRRITRRAEELAAVLVTALRTAHVPGRHPRKIESGASAWTSARAGIRR